jgi:hypothetical protein
MGILGADRFDESLKEGILAPRSHIPPSQSGVAAGDASMNLDDPIQHLDDHGVPE